MAIASLGVLLLAVGVGCWVWRLAFGSVAGGVAVWLWRWRLAGPVLWWCLVRLAVALALVWWLWLVGVGCAVLVAGGWCWWLCWFAGWRLASGLLMLVSRWR